MLLNISVSAYPQSQFFQQSATSSPQRFKEKLLHNCMYALPQLFAEVQTQNKVAKLRLRTLKFGLLHFYNSAGSTHVDVDVSLRWTWI
jgi:hypothetical protein